MIHYLVNSALMHQTKWFRRLSMACSKEWVGVISLLFLLKSKKIGGRNLEADGAPEVQEKRGRQAVQTGSLKFSFFFLFSEKLLISDRQVVTSFHSNLLGQKGVESGFPHFTEGKHRHSEVKDESLDKPERTLWWYLPLWGWAHSSSEARTLKSTSPAQLLSFWGTIHSLIFTSDSNPPGILKRASTLPFPLSAEGLDPGKQWKEEIWDRHLFPSHLPRSPPPVVHRRQSFSC